MSTLRISNIEAKANAGSASLDEKLKFTNSVGDVLVYLDGKTSGITTVGINTTDQTIKFDKNNNLDITGIVTATKFSGPFDGTTVTATTGTFSGDVSIGGTLTYQDVTNVDAVGLITARAGVNISGGEIAVGAGFSVGQAGVVTATKYYGDGSSLTGITGTTINNNAANRVITGEGGTTLNGEANLTFDGNNLNLVDEKSLYFGTGNDLRLWHNAAGGHHSYIMNHGAGVLKIGRDTQLIIGKTGNATYIECNPDNTVKLFYNNVQKLATTNTGIDVTGDARISNSGGNAKLKIKRSNTASNTDDYGSILFQSSADNNNVSIGAARQSAENDAYLFFSTATGGTLAERLRITSTGKILIGTTTPQGNANADDLVVSSGGTTGITIRSGGTSYNGNIFFARGTSGSDEYRGWITYDHSQQHLTFGTNAGEIFRAYSGRFGIGTASPSRTLEVRGPHDSHLAITVPGTTQTSALLFGDSGDDDIGAISYIHSDNSMRFVTNAAERLRFASAGQIGIAGANYGSAGQALLSGGSGATVTWGAPAAPSIGVAGNYPGNHVIFGTNAGLYGSANYKICIGPDAGRYGSARHNNVFIGVGAGKGASSGTVNGQSNVCVGQYTAQDLTTGSSNTCLGPNAGENLTTGNHNVIIGSCGRSVQNSENSTIIGKSAGYSITQSSQSVILGHGASGETLQGDAADNQLFIARQGYGGGSSGTWIYGNSSGQCQQGGGSSSWYTGSDERYKDFLGKYPRGLTEINGLEVQNFKWKDKDNMPSIAFNYAGSYCGPEIDGKTRIGVGAQSCEALIPEAVNKLEPAEIEKGGNHMLTLDNDPIFWAMVNAIQELSAKNDALTARVTALES